MINDAKLRFCKYQALTATAVSADVLDLGAAAPDIGTGRTIFFDVEVSETFAGGTSVQPVLQDSADNSSFADKVSFAAIAVANLTAGARLRLGVPEGSFRRYARVNFVVVGTPTAGKVSAKLSIG